MVEKDFPFVKIIIGAFPSLYKSIPAKNLSGSNHSTIFSFPGAGCLEPLSTTIASDTRAFFELTLCHGLSTNLHNNSETIPLLKNKIGIKPIKK